MGQGRGTNWSQLESRKGDQPGLAVIYRFVEQTLGSYISRRTPPQVDPHDVSIETVLRATASATNLPPEVDWPRYFRRIVNNVIRDLSTAQSALVDRRKRRTSSPDSAGVRLSWEELVQQVDELTLSELRVDFARARGELEVLEAETYHELTHARAALRERGEYIEYAQGEKYATQPGTLTAAEPLPGGGVRMFYLSQAEFPELYAKRAERDARAERSLREILKRMNDL